MKLKQAAHRVWGRCGWRGLVEPAASCGNNNNCSNVAATEDALGITKTEMKVI